MCNLLGIKQNISSAYHPQTDGQSERTNQSLEQYLRLYCGTHQKDWAAWLPLAQYTRNSWPNASTKKSPYELILGYTPLAHQPSRDTTAVPDLNARIQLIKEAREQAQEALKRTQEAMVKESKFKGFEIGNKVWLEGTNIKRPYNSQKLSPKRYGPFKVVAKISHVAYKLNIPHTWQIHDVFHASLLTPYKETVEHGKNFLEPPPDVIEGEEEWEVEQILEKRHFGRGKRLQYLVRWKGYSLAHDQWIYKEDMAADDLIKIYERENRSNEEDCPPRTRGKRIRATMVDFDSPEIASSWEASEEPADMNILAAWARTKKTHWAQTLDQKERIRINRLVLLAWAAVAFRAKHGGFPRKLRRGFFNLVHRLGRIKGKLTAYPSDFTAQDFGNLDSLIKCFRVIHGELQPFIGAPVADIRQKSKSRTPPVSSVGSAPTPTSAYNPGTLLPLDIPLAPPPSTPIIMPTTSVPRLTPDVTADPGWEQLLRETFAPKYKAPVVTPVLSPMEATPSSCLSPPAAAAPLEDPVSMLDQPELTPEWEAYLKQSTPPDIGIKRKREPSPTFGKNYPTKKDSPFSTPHRTPHIPSAPMSYAPTRLPSPEPLPPAASAVPVTEESDLRVQQVPWEGHDVMIPAVTPTFSSTSRPTASPEVPRDTSSGHVPLGSHVIHPRTPSSHPLPRDPVSRPRWA